MNKTQHMTAEEFRAMIVKDNSKEIIHDAPETKFKNRCNNDRGRAFENLLVKGCQHYEQRGRAVISKVYEPYRCTKKLTGGRFIGQWIGRAEPDFKGVLRGGRAIAFEAKSTRKEHINRDALTKEQMKWLMAQAEMGALAFVCADICGRFFALPWYMWHDMHSIFGKKSLTQDDIAQYEVIYDGAVRYLEYINGKSLDDHMD